MGQVELTVCGAEYTRGLGELANIASYAEKGMLPQPGTILDQSAWFIDFWHSLQSQLNKVEAEKLERVRRR